MTSSFTDSIQALDQQLIQLVYRSRSLIEGAEYDKLSVFKWFETGGLIS